MASINVPQLRTDERIWISDTDSEPTVDVDGGTLPVGRELQREGGSVKYWNGASWQAVTETQKLCQVADFLREIRDLLNSEE